MITLIVAYSKNRVIGDKGKIPWSIPGEQKRFKELTTGNVVIMGRRSYEEIGHPLPNRLTIVISSNIEIDGEGLLNASSLEEAIRPAGNRDIFVAGGQRLYAEAVPVVDRMYVTEVELEIEGDTVFPEFDENQFEREVEKEFNGETPYKYITYIRKD